MTKTATSVHTRLSHTHTIVSFYMRQHRAGWCFRVDSRNGRWRVRTTSVPESNWAEETSSVGSWRAPASLCYREGDAGGVRPTSLGNNISPKWLVQSDAILNAGRDSGVPHRRDLSRVTSAFEILGWTRITISNKAPLTNEGLISLGRKYSCVTTHFTDAFLFFLDFRKRTLK